MKTDGRPQLRYCPVCHQVWEYDRSQGRELKHKDFPAYGLYREACSDCQKVKTPLT